MMPRFLSFAPQKYTRVALLCTTVILIITLIRIQPTGVLQPLTFSTKTEVPQPVAVTTTTEEVTEPKDPYEVYVRYAYYYPISKSLGDNAIALVMHADYHWVNETKTINIRSWNSTANQTSICKLEMMNPWNGRMCQFLAVYSSCQVIPGLTRLQLDLGNEFHDISFSVVSYEKKDVVTCISPLFAAEQWQIFTFSAHVYKKFGSFLHVYVRSMVRPMYELAQVYEKEGYMKIQPWTRIVFTSVPEYMFNPNMHVAFRSQEGAQTDCLLQYKEAAEFVAFMDLDDILMPRLAPTYVEEFRMLIPNVNFIFYNKENVYVEASMKPQEFSLEHMLKSIHFSHKTETGKYTTRPTLVNYTNIHTPTIPNRDLAYRVKNEENCIIHLKKLFPLGTSNDEKKLWPYDFNSNISTIFNETDVAVLEEDFRRMFSSHSSEWLQQPTTTSYIQHLSNCYHVHFYRHWYSNHAERVKKCINPDVCRIPLNVTAPCANAGGDFFSTEHGTTINIHYARNERFIIEDRCIP